MGGHDSVTEGGWEWMDGSPFRYIRWAAGTVFAQQDFFENVLKDLSEALEIKLILLQEVKKYE